jgi:hypothetical protein
MTLGIFLLKSRITNDNWTEKLAEKVGHEIQEWAEFTHLVNSDDVFKFGLKNLSSQFASVIFARI